MEFLYPEFILYMVPPALVLLYLVITNKSSIERIFSEKVLRRLKIEQGLPKRFRLVLMFVALFLMIVAMARPVFNKGIVEVQKRAKKVVIALDISKSMLANDFYPNRLEFAKAKIKKFIQRSHNLQIGLIAFSKDAYILAPVTDDKESLLYLLDHLQTNLLPFAGTNILAPLMSVNLMLANEKEKNIILVTDGGEKRDFSHEIAYAKKHHIKVYAWGVGTLKGAPIKEDGAYIKDKKGNIVIVRLNLALQRLAQKTGGFFVQAKIDDSDIKKFLDIFESKAHKIETKLVPLRSELYPYFLALALLLLISVFYSFPQRVMFILIPLLPYSLHAGIKDFAVIKEANEAYVAKEYKKAATLFKKVAASKNSAQSYYDLGNALYKSNRFQEALKAYEKVQTSNKELEFRKLHNMGNTFFKLHNYKKAIQMYEKALKIKEDRDTRFNLELAKKMLKQKSSSKKEQKNNKKQHQKKPQNQSQQKNKKTNDKKRQKPSQKEQNKPISSREEKRWLKEVQKKMAPSLLYKIPLKNKKEAENENPW